MKNIGIEIKWALIFVIIQLLWMLLERVAGLHSENIDKHAMFTNFFAIPAIAVYVVALLDKRKNHYGGFMTYGQGFISGVIITVIVTILSPLTQYIICTVISPDYFRNATEYAVSSGKLTQEAAETYYSLKSYIIQGLIGAPIMGLITTAIVALFTRKNNKPEAAEVA
ncbi:DUF4199 domain-containing protein [Prolixibacter denitrificans]|uniref:Uncharacterized protein DUF4199 n=1 Tax=Prolixibacter denitrificans TaxID=1541063 RepID=A0A2P8CBH7_9BACT|nr:DUF4199 domain-containing protein [Prolixibacter denitrificans]PSK82307.1 uncharacterized protein DUF4199 [Prolixibacter denitrificans]GET22945.1 hypothetical protein JCM18694_31910 [Prolixibacter denitrificans]